MQKYSFKVSDHGSILSFAPDFKQNMYYSRPVESNPWVICDSSHSLALMHEINELSYITLCFYIIPLLHY